MAFNLSTIKEYFGILDETEDYYDEVENVATVAAPAATKQQFRSTGTSSAVAVDTNESSNWFSRRKTESTVSETYSEPQEKRTVNSRESAKVVSMTTPSYVDSREEQERKIRNEVIKRIVIIEPRIQNECNDIAVRILKNEIVIINFRVMEEHDARRVVDFVNGVLFALNGKFERIGDEMFICTPPNMEVEGSIAKSMVGTNRQRFDLQ